MTIIYYSFFSSLDFDVFCSVFASLNILMCNRVCTYICWIWLNTGWWLAGWLAGWLACIALVCVLIIRYYWENCINRIESVRFVVVVWNCIRGRGIKSHHHQQQQRNWIENTHKNIWKSDEKISRSTECSIYRHHHNNVSCSLNFSTVQATTQ